MGRFFVLSMTGRDYPMIMAVILLYGGFLTVMNLVVDLVYGFIDPASVLASNVADIVAAAPSAATTSLWRGTPGAAHSHKLAVVARHRRVPARALGLASPTSMDTARACRSYEARSA